ncbi:MAG: 50S ribosomal protein L11 methyltransferase [Deltaproteobacteria bacterium]|nr:50S ribosomal protein L11 methyltransferase [Deltaproteobacteria bacterium]
MQKDDLLTIYELRVEQPQDRAKIIELDLKQILGPSLSGFHFEEDFLFLFCINPTDLTPLYQKVPHLELKTQHLLRYSEWQDGAGANPIFVGPLQIYPSTFKDAQADLLESPDPVFRSSPEVPPLSTSLGFTEILPPLYLDPGLAFGYGGHPTTQDSLLFLIKLFSPLNPKIPQKGLDLGTGTGVLALAAARLGIQGILGVDHSHLAVEAAQKNVALNQLEERVTIVRGLAAAYADFPADLVMANVPYFVHTEFLELRGYDNRQHLILSGLLHEEGEKFITQLKERYCVEILDQIRDDRWISYLLQV